MSAGQVPPGTPGQNSAGGHEPAARHWVPPDANTSLGHAALDPVQSSGGSQTSPEPARHTVVDGANAFAGHAALVPLHVSATSHTPALERQTVPDGFF
jgi:hypothetical protein